MEDDTDSRQKSEMNRLASPFKDGSFQASPSKRSSRNNRSVAAASAIATVTTVTAVTDVASAPPESWIFLNTVN